MNTGNKKIRIANKLIGEGEPTFIIAEVGSNHNQKLTQAKELIDVAYESGADAVKFQLFRADVLYPNSNNKIFKIMRENEFPRKWLIELYGYAKKKGLIFLASPFDKEAIDLLDDLGSPAIKWASSETVNLPLLRYAASKHKPILISTGMCNLADLFEAITVISSSGNDNIILLQCTSLYPAKAKDVNLHVMDTLRSSFRLPVGLSDHTLSITIAVAAVARGACVIEKHFTLNRKLKGPDHSYALEPEEFKDMVRSIREVELCLGSYEKRMLDDEKKVARRKSIIAKVNLSKGTQLTQYAVDVGSSGLGIEPRFISAVLGAKTKRRICKGQIICWGMLE